MPNSLTDIYKSIPGLETAVDSLNALADKANEALGVIKKTSNEAVDGFIKSALGTTEATKIDLGDEFSTIPSRPGSPSSVGILDGKGITDAVGAKVSNPDSSNSANVNPSSAATQATNSNAAAQSAQASSSASSTPSSSSGLTAKKDPIVIKSQKKNSEESDQVSALSENGRKLGIRTGSTPKDSWNELIEGVYNLIYPRIVNDFVHKKDDYSRWIYAIDVLKGHHPRIVGVKLLIPPVEGWKGCKDDKLHGKTRNYENRAAFVSYEQGKWADAENAKGLAAQDAEQISSGGASSSSAGSTGASSGGAAAASSGAATSTGVGGATGTSTSNTPVEGAANVTSGIFDSMSSLATGAVNGLKSLASDATKSMTSTLGTAGAFLQDRMAGSLSNTIATSAALDMVTGSFLGSNLVGALGSDGAGAAVGKPITGENDEYDEEGDAVSNSGEGGVSNALMDALYQVDSFLMEHNLDQYMVQALNGGSLSDIVGQAVGNELTNAIGGDTGAVLGSAIQQVFNTNDGRSFLSKALSSLSNSNTINEGLRIGSGYAGSFLTKGLSSLVGTDMAATIGNALGNQLTGSLTSALSTGSVNALGNALSNSFNRALGNSLGAVSNELTSKLSQAIGGSALGNAVSNGIGAAASSLTGAVGSAIGSGNYGDALNAALGNGQNALNSLLSSTANSLLGSVEALTKEDPLKDLNPGKFLPKMKALSDASALAGKAVSNINKGLSKLSGMLNKALGKLSLKLQIGAVDKLFDGASMEIPDLSGVIDDPMQGYVHEQLNKNSQWLIQQSKSMLPDNGNSLSIVDAEGFNIQADEVYTNSNGDKVLTFSTPVAGKAVINSINYQSIPDVDPAAEAASVIKDAISGTDVAKKVEATVQKVTNGVTTINTGRLKLSDKLTLKSVNDLIKKSTV